MKLSKAEEDHLESLKNQASQVWENHPPPTNAQELLDVLLAIEQLRNEFIKLLNLYIKNSSKRFKSAETDANDYYHALNQILKTHLEINRQFELSGLGVVTVRINPVITLDPALFQPDLFTISFKDGSRAATRYLAIHLLAMQRIFNDKMTQFAEARVVNITRDGFQNR